MPAAHTALPRIHSDALRILAAPDDYPPNLVALARLARATLIGRPLPQRVRATRRIPAPVTLPPALRLITGGLA